MSTGAAPPPSPPGSSGTVHESLAVSLFHVERASYRTLRLENNTHPHWAISHVAAGSGPVETRSRGERALARAGDVMVHPPRVAYDELASAPGTHEWLLLEATAAPNVDLLRLHPVAPVVRLGEDGGMFSAAFERLLCAWREPAGAASPFRGLRIYALATELLGLVLGAWHDSGSPARPAALETPEDRFTQVIAYMADHLHEKLSRDDLAARLCLHPVYFDRVFRAAHGLSPLALLRQMRLDRAKRLLENSDETLESIAAACGFGSASHLSRHFVSAFAQTPGDYRQRLKQARNRFPRAL